MVHSAVQVVEGLLKSCQALLLQPDFAAEGPLHKMVSGRLLRMLALCQPTATMLLQSPTYQALAGQFFLNDSRPLGCTCSIQNVLEMIGPGMGDEEQHSAMALLHCLQLCWQVM